MQNESMPLYESAEGSLESSCSIRPIESVHKVRDVLG